MLAIALKPFGERSFVGLMKFPAALLTSPLRGPDSSQMRWTIASTACASRMSIACVRTLPPSSFAVCSRTAPRRPAIQTSAPRATYLAAISRPRPVPPPVTRMRLPLRRPSLNMCAPRSRAHSKRREVRKADGQHEERDADPRNRRIARVARHVRDEQAARGGAERLAQVYRRGVERDRDRRARRRQLDQPRLLRAIGG